jgi:hypothetical protein
MIPFLFHLAPSRNVSTPNPASSPTAREWAWNRIRNLQNETFPELDLPRIGRVLGDVLSLFRGAFPGYCPCDTRYHDEEHTLRLVPVFCQLAEALARGPFSGSLTAGEVELGLAAVLLHDSGYFRSLGDTAGTGAKYTFRHIERSVAFAQSYLPTVGYLPSHLRCVEEMIRCTGVKAELEQVHFQTPSTQWMGYALGTADLLAQMADPAYVDKLPLLFAEFQEAYRFEGELQLRDWGIQPMRTAQELIEKTPLFFRQVVMVRLEAMGAVYRLLGDPVTGGNPYLERVHRNISAITRA